MSFKCLYFMNPIKAEDYIAKSSYDILKAEDNYTF